MKNRGSLKFKRFKVLSNDFNTINKIVNIFLLTGGKLMPELHLRQPGFTDSAS